MGTPRSPPGGAAEWGGVSTAASPSERTRPELLSEETQRRFLQDIQNFQEPEVSRQLEDFRS